MTKTFTKIALWAAAAAAVALPATGALAASQTQSALLGALLGGVAGAAVGHGKTEGVVLGAVAGAVIGAAVDPKENRRHNDRSRYVQRDVRPHHQDTGYGDYDARRRDDRDSAWSQDRYGYGSSYGNGYGGYGDRR